MKEEGESTARLARDSLLKSVLATVKSVAARLDAVRILGKATKMRKSV